MSKFNRFRWVSRIVALVSGIAALIALVVQYAPLAAVGVAVLAADIIAIALKTRCPFCHKALRITPPMNSEEFCPYCGCKIE